MLSADRAKTVWEWSHEWYDTGDRYIRRRTAALRRLNVVVTVSPMGPQLTDGGYVKRTLLDIRRNGVDECVWQTIMTRSASHPRRNGVI